MEWSGLAECLLLLSTAAQDAAKGHSSRAAAVSNVQISLEEGLFKRGRHCAENFEVQKQLELAEVERRPSEWVGREVHRREVTAAVHGRADAETSERSR